MLVITMQMLSPIQFNHVSKDETWPACTQLTKALTLSFIPHLRLSSRIAE